MHTQKEKRANLAEQQFRADPDRSTTRWLATVFASLLLLVEPCRAQIAITEVMSYPIDQPQLGVDFWELTNFGEEAVDVSEYLFRDEGSAATAEKLGNLWTQSRSDSPVIAPGESVIFFRQGANRILTPDEFRSWWGITGDTRVISYTSFGFNDLGNDFVNLWKKSPGQPNLVQRVELFESLRGRTFTYNPDDGRLNRFSTEGIDGAFKALRSDDIGSPGKHLGPVSLRFTATPQDIEIDAGAPVSFSARAVGLPVPQYQWHLNGEVIPGQTASTLNLTAATKADEGDYTVEIQNGLERLMSDPARLTVNTQPSCAAIVRGPSNTEVTPGHTAVFRVEVRGYPLPTIQWSFQGSPIPGGNSTELRVPTIDFSQSGLYSASVSNALCSTNASAMLRVVPEDRLFITEVMAEPTNKVEQSHNTWWELTNIGTNIVNLRGYRWDDKTPDFDVGAIIITNDILLPPGKSAIFVSDMSAEAFRNWWGEDNLPADLPIITHSGNGLNPIDEWIRIWNPSATKDDEFLIDFPFDNAEAGISKLFDPNAPDSERGILSVEGQRGAFRAVESNDIGSPGWTSNEQRVIRPKVSIRKEPGGVRVNWKSQPGRTYELRYCDTPSGANWSLSARVVASAESTSAFDATSTGITQRFYKVILLP